MGGIKQVMVVELADVILQREFMAVPTNTVIESADEKCYPVIAIWYPPPKEPDDGLIL
jgi:hypothetical protein